MQAIEQIMQPIKIKVHTLMYVSIYEMFETKLQSIYWLCVW